MEMLLQLGPHLHTDPLLLAKMLRVGRAFLKEKGGSSSDGGMSQEERVRGAVCEWKVSKIVLWPLVMHSFDCARQECFL